MYPTSTKTGSVSKKDYDDEQTRKKAIIMGHVERFEAQIMRLQSQGKHLLCEIMYYDTDFAEEIAENLRNMFAGSKIHVHPYTLCGNITAAEYKQITIQLPTK
jgi:hypothetical protein